jgi:hypothetical protein
MGRVWRGASSVPSVLPPWASSSSPISSSGGTPTSSSGVSGSSFFRFFRAESPGGLQVGIAPRDPPLPRL